MYTHIAFLLFLISPTICEKSFTVVLDTTVSMKDEINIIKANIGHVVNYLNKSQFSNYIIVPFKDAVIEQPYISENPRDYVSHINSINPSGGLDCPENSLSGVEMALRNSHDDSKIFLFTDAYAKDFNNFLTVRDLCKERNSQVTIFLSGFCLPSDSGNIGSLDVYYDVAKACSGTFLLFDTAFELRQAFAFMKEMASIDWTDITVTEKYTGHKQFTHNIDPFTTDFIIAISAKYAIVDVYISNQPQNYEKLLETRHSMVIRIIKPIAGYYTINIRANGAIAATIYEKNYIPFQYGFSTKRPGSLRETSSKPIAGWTNYILISIDTSIKLNEIELLTYGENEKKMIYLEEIKPGIYLCSTFVYPEKSFKFWVSGKDKRTSQNIKVSTKFISHQTQEANPTWIAPISNILSLDTNLIDYGSNLTVICKVHGYPKPTIHWEDENRKVLPSEDVLLEIPNIHLSYINITSLSRNMTISCISQNTRGQSTDSIEIFVNRTFSFDVIKVPEDATVEYGDELTLYCEVNAYPDASIKWYRNGTEISTEYLDNVQINKEENSLIVNNFGFDDVGLYECVASNEVETRNFSVTVDITGIESPTVDIEESEIILKPGDHKDIECRVTGRPDPAVEWKYRASLSDEFTDLPDDVEYENGHLKFTSVAKQQGGIYRCLASNVIGEDSKDILIKIQYAPIIKNNETNRLTVKEGEIVNLFCEVESIPEATVRWEMTQDDLMIVLDERHTTDRMNTHQFTALYNDSGYYHCIAENNVGKSEKTIFVNVLVAPYIEPISEDITANIGDNIDLQCNVSHGNPAPSTRWEFIGPDLMPRILKRGNSKNTLHLSKLSKNQEGTYLCIAENQINTDRIRYHLKIK